METIEIKLKRELSLNNYRKDVFNVEFCDHVESENVCWISLNTGNQDFDIKTLKRAEKVLKSQIDKIIRCESYFEESYHFGRGKYEGSQLIIKLK